MSRAEVEEDRTGLTGWMSRWQARAGALSRRSTVLAVGREAALLARDDRATGLAAEVAFYAVLSVFPALITIAAAVGFLDTLASERLAGEAERQVAEWMALFLTDRASHTIDAVRSLFEERSGNVLTFAVVAAAWTASRGTSALVRAIREMYEVEEHRSWIRQRMVGLALLLVTILVVAAAVAMFVLGPLLGRGRAVADVVGFGSVFGTAWDWARFPLLFVVVVAWATLVYQLASNRRGGWRDDLPGAAFTAIGWIAVSLGLRTYLTLAGGANSVFGVLGGALILLVWLYLLALTLLLGAEVNAAIRGRSAR